VMSVAGVVSPVDTIASSPLQPSVIESANETAIRAGRMCTRLTSRASIIGGADRLRQGPRTHLANEDVGRDFVVRLPGDVVMRCNPVTRSELCVDSELVEQFDRWSDASGAHHGEAGEPGDLRRDPIVRRCYR